MALTASHQTKRASYRQRRMGPAPFASLEDLSDDQDSPPPGNNGSRLTVLPGIKEDSLQMPATPRIDISRASSSSHQDSNNSSPERELFAGSGEGGMKLGLGFKEEGAADLRSSTEELDFTDDPIGENRQRRDSQRSLRKRSGSVSKYELEAQSEKERKDSLSIISTGRTSRLSSIGSAASAASSAASHLSVASSGGRSPSPHKMLLETSFCGSKPLVPQASIELDEVPGAKEALHQADPTAVIATADLHQHIRRSSSSASRHRRAAEDAILIMPNVTAVVSPAERELLAAKEKALQEEVQRELENRRAERPPATLNLKGGPDAPPRSISGTPSASPKPTRHHSSMAVGDSRTPSPCSVSRKHSFASLFRRGGGETTPSSVMSPESPIKRNKSGSFTTILGEGFRERSRSRSKSRERPAAAADGPVAAPGLDAKGRKDSKNKSVFSSLFKKKERKRGSKTNVADSELSSPEPRVSGVIEPMGNVEFTFNSEAPPQPATATSSSSSVCNVVHRSERRGSSCEEKQVPESSSEHRRSNSSKRMGIHEEQLLPSESVMLPGMPQDLADVLTVSGVGEEDAWWKKRESAAEAREARAEGRGRAAQEDDDGKRESVAKSEGSVQEEKAESPPEEAAPPASESAEPPQGAEEDRVSSGSERDSEIDFVRAKVDPEAGAAAAGGEEEEEDDHERKGLVLQQDSFEDELPYVPTTLPQERSIAVPIIPVKQRVTQEVRTCPIERPRSTTPINPSLLEEYVQQGSSGGEADGDKMRIQLPKTGSVSEEPGAAKARSPWRVAGTGRSWFEFAEQGSGLQQSPREHRKPSLPASSPSPPPLPPRAPQQQQQQQPKQWINFEDIPEKRKPAKRIQTIPARVGAEQPVVYSYVNPEDCKCECHEAAGGKGRQTKQNGEAQHEKKAPEQAAGSSNKLEVNENTDRNSYLSDSSYEYPNSYGNDPVDYSDGLKPTKPFGMDLDVSSNRSSIISQDETQSPEIGSPNGLKQ